VPHGFATFSEALRAGVEVFHALKQILRKQKKVTAVGDEGGFAPRHGEQRGGAGDAAGSDRGGRLQAGRADQPGARRRGVGVLRQGHAEIRAGWRGRALADVGRSWSSCTRSWPRSSRWCRSRTAWPRTTGTAGSCSPTASARPCSWSATTCSSPTRPASHRHRPRHRQLDPRQGQPDRHAHRDPRGGPAGPAQPLPRGDLAPQRRDGRHLHRRPRRRDQRRADQDRLGFALRPRREVQPAPAHRGAARRHGPLRRARRCSESVVPMSRLDAVLWVESQRLRFPTAATGALAAGAGLGCERRPRRLAAATRRAGVRARVDRARARRACRPARRSAR
jgi:hypothetical protein